MADIDQFIRNFSFAGARPSLYEVLIINVPDVFESSEQMIYLCKSAMLPASTIGNIPIPFMGRQVKLPGVRTYEDFTLGFYNDEDFAIRHAFEKWMHKMAKFKSVYGSNVKIGDEGIATDVWVSQMTKDGQYAREYRFVKAFPVSVSSIELGYDQGETIEEFTVQFAYQYFDIPAPAAQSISADGESGSGGGTPDFT
tara:strand:- start:8559 stop:9149 length:591 start_codon:yes stop_codon:yes gene_type:complete